MKHSIVLYGNCAASSLVLGYRQEQERYPDCSIFFWAMSAQQYLIPFFRTEEESLVIFDVSKRERSVKEFDPDNVKGGGAYAPEDPDDKKLLKLWINGPKEFPVPLATDPERSFFYCFCSPIMPNLAIDAFIQDYFAGRLMCSRQMLVEMLLGYMRPQLDYIRQARALLPNFLVVEGPRRLCHECDPALYCAADLFFRNTIKKAIRDVGVEVLDILPVLHDEQGFTHERFRAYRERLKDTVHMNADYGAILFEKLVRRIRRSNA